MLKRAFEDGRTAALRRYKIANAMHGYPPSNPSLNPMQSTAAAMPTMTPKPSLAPTAPMAAAAPRANVLG